MEKKKYRILFLMQKRKKIIMKIIIMKKIKTKIKIEIKIKIKKIHKFILKQELILRK
jgi:hypothetical protein